jgi:hypothetical protein
MLNLFAYHKPKPFGPQEVEENKTSQLMPIEMKTRNSHRYILEPGIFIASDG